MRSKKHGKKSLSVISSFGQALSVLGSPFLLLIKAFLYIAILSEKQAAALNRAASATLLSITRFCSRLKRAVPVGTRRFRQKARRAISHFQKQTAAADIFVRKLLFRCRAALSSLSLPRLPVWHRRQKVRPTLFPATLINRSLAFFSAGALSCFFLLFLPYFVRTELEKLPHPALLSGRDIPVSTKIFDRHGTLLYSFYREENRSLVALDNLPPYLINATVAVEDKNFFLHPGFDLSGIVRAAWANVSGENLQGGSTITQQLIKSALLTPERTVARKIKELFLSFWAERIYSKKEILAMYLNQVSYGGAAYGVETAAQSYFGKAARDLTLPEAAFLAGMPSAPSTYSPFTGELSQAKSRQKQVLTAMTAQGYLSAEEAEKAFREELPFASPETAIKAPHFVMFVRDYLVSKYGRHLVETGGLEVRTTLDYSLYEKASRILREGVEKQKYLRVGNGAVLVTNPKTGEILVMVGAKDFFDLKNDGHVNVTTALRSPGSALKPLNYALAFEQGLITPATILDDQPVIYSLPGQAPYRPQNYDGQFHGKVTARLALGSSYNIPAVKVLEKNGVENFLNFAASAGITTFLDRSRYGLSVTLGGGEIRMTDMATAFSLFPNNGLRVDLNPIISIKDFRGRVLEDTTSYGPRATSPARIISPQTAFLINNILSDDAARAPAFGAGSVLNIPGHTVAVKTGTAETKRDNWTIGYTPSYLVAVWVGNNDNSPMSPFLESGNTGAAAIWSPLVREILKDRPNEPFAPPEEIISVPICALNGLLPCENCPSVRSEFFRRGTEPKTACKITSKELEKIKGEKGEKN